MTTTTEARVLDKNGQPIETIRAPGGAIATRPAAMDMGRLDLLDPANLDERAIEVLERRGKFREAVVSMALRQTAVSQWVVFKGEGADARETIYPMGAAADAMFGFVGLSWAQIVEDRDERTNAILRKGKERFDAQLQDDGDGGRYWWVTSGLWNSSGDLFAPFEGKRKIGSGYAKNPLDAKIDAFENLKSRACRAVFGLAGKTREDFVKMGLDLSKVRIATFQDHKSVTSEDPNEATIPFGNETKGKKVVECTDEQLAWVKGAITKSIKDPAKSNFKAKNEMLLKAIDAEIERRVSKPAADAATEAELKATIDKLRDLAKSAGKLDAFEAKVAKGVSLAQAKRWLQQEEAKAKPAQPEPGSQG